MNNAQKKGYYIYFANGNGSLGVEKKVHNQVAEIKKYFQCEKIVVEKEQTHFFKSLMWRLPLGSYGRKYEEALKKINNPDYIYIRFAPVDIRYLGFLKKIREQWPKVKILMEVATYPYKNELLGDVEMFPFYLKDLYYNHFLKRYVNKVVTFADIDYIFGISTIKTLNGIDIEGVQPIKGNANDKKQIDLLAVAMLQKSHGYERCILGLAEYYAKKPERLVYLHIVGEGSELGYYKQLVERYCLNQYVIFYGKKSGQELEQIYELADIGLGCFGLYKRKITKISSLKIGEYLAKGLPVITGCPENILDYEDTQYIQTVSNDESSIAVDEILRFYDKIYKGNKRGTVHRETREYAKRTVDMHVTMQPIIEYLVRKS